MIIPITTPTISVIMPVYNCKEYLEAAISSVLSQNVDRLEIIAIDDCSTDGSRELLRELADRDRRIKAFFNEKNSGVAAVRNLALKLADGEYLAFCDSDDTVPEGAYSGMLRDIGECDVLISGFSDVNDSGVCRTTLVNKRDRGSCFRSLFHVSCLWNKLIRRKSVEGLTFDEDMKIGEDVVFLSRYATRNPSFTVSDRLVYNHCHHENAATPSLTHIYSYSAFCEHIKCRERMLDICTEGGITECRDYVFNYFIEYIDRFLIFISDPEDRRLAFLLYRDFMKRYDWSAHRDEFTAMSGVEYDAFLTADVDAYIQLKYDALPRDRVLNEYRAGKIGLRWIVKYFRAWLAYKLGKRK